MARTAPGARAKEPSESPFLNFSQILQSSQALFCSAYLPFSPPVFADNVIIRQLPWQEE